MMNTLLTRLTGYQSSPPPPPPPHILRFTWRRTPCQYPKRQNFWKLNVSNMNNGKCSDCIVRLLLVPCWRALKYLERECYYLSLYPSQFRVENGLSSDAVQGTIRTPANRTSVSLTYRLSHQSPSSPTDAVKLTYLTYCRHIDRLAHNRRRQADLPDLLPVISIA